MSVISRKGRNITMDYNNDWYERYASTTPQSGRYAPKQKRGVGVAALISCMLVAALLGGVIGGYVAKAYVDKSLSAMNATLENKTTESAQSAPSQTITDDEQDSTPAISAQLQPGASASYSKAQIIELCAPAVVGIDTTYTYTSSYGFGGSNSQQTATGSGSGIVLTSDGYIVTCRHVVEGADTVTVVLNDDTEHAATLIGTDTRYDLAVIKIDATGLSPATLGDSDMLTVGDDVIAIGNPLGELRGTATSGMISALGREVTVENTNMTLLQTDAAISPGNSGGGLFNSSGSLIGIVNAKASSENSEGLGFAIPVKASSRSFPI